MIMSPEQYTWRDIAAAWECPRQFGYSREGWQLYKANTPLLRGQFVHAALLAHFKNDDLRGGLAAVVQDRIDLVSKGGYSDEVTNIQNIGKASLELAQRYLSTYGQDLESIAVETRIRQVVKADPPFIIGGTPDHIVHHEGRRVLVELKTGAGDPRVISMSGQGDFYAWLDGGIELIYFDIINDSVVIRLSRPPREHIGIYVFKELSNLALRVRQTDPKDHPKYGWWCGHCDFFDVCQARDNGDDEEDILLQFFYLEDTNG